MEQVSLPRANVYVEGFNFYYGCFKNNSRQDWKQYKWVDLASFIAKVYPNLKVNRIRYFTAYVNPSPEDPDQRNRQITYHRALETTPNLTIHLGRFATNVKWRSKADLTAFSKRRRPKALSPTEKVAVIEEEEKGSDVNLASHLLVDAFAHEYEVAVVVSNDSDLAEPIRLARSVLERRIMLLNPRSKTATDLVGIADDYRTVRLGPIRDSQFPDSLTDENGIIEKPSEWRLLDPELLRSLST